jgi:hypothetical protein
MRKSSVGVLCLVVGTCMSVWAADWPSTGGNPQRDGWAGGETVLSRENIAANKVQLLYKYKFDNTARGLNALTAPLDLSALIGYEGFKELLFIGGSSDTVYSIDSDLGVSYFKTKLKPMAEVPTAPSTVACPGGLTSDIAMPGVSAPRPRGVGGAPRGTLAALFALGSDGYLRTLRQQDGDAEYVAPVKFVPAGSAATGLNVDNGVIYVSTVNGCGGNPNALYAATYVLPGMPPMPGKPVLSPAKFDVTSFMTNGSGFSGTGGTAIGAKGTVYGQVAEGHGDVAGTYSDTVLALDPKTLAVQDYFTPSGTLPALKKGIVSTGVTPVTFMSGTTEVVVAGGRDGRLYVLDAASLGGADHHTPLSKTAVIVAPDAEAGNGIFGNFSTFVDTANGDTRWLFAAIHGPVAGAATGSIVAFKVEDKGGKPTLTQQWVSSDLISPAAPVTANGLVFALSTGESPRVARKDGAPLTAAEIEKASKPAVLHILDAATGKDLYTSGTAATTFAHSGLALANGRVYFSTHDNTLFAYGVPMIR